MRRWLLLVPAVALLAAVNVQRAREADRLTACRTEAEEQLSHLVAKALSVEQYAGPALSSPGVPSAVRRSLEQLVTGTVARELPLVVAARQGCGFRTLPWSGTADRRDAYVADLDSRIAILQRAAHDREALHDPELFSP